MTAPAAVTAWRLTPKGEEAVKMSDGLGWPSAAAFAQLAALVKEQGAAIAQLEARVARLDTHGGELAGEVLDLVTRVDLLDEAAARRTLAHERDHDRLNADVRRTVDDHEWREHRR
jgi:hypothetical protein